MLHKAWNSKGEMPYRFPRSSVKFQGHMVQNITDFYPNWAFPDYRPVAAFKSLRFVLFNKKYTNIVLYGRHRGHRHPGGQVKIFSQYINEPVQNFGPPARNFGSPARNFGPPARIFGPTKQSSPGGSDGKCLAESERKLQENMLATCSLMYIQLIYIACHIKTCFWLQFNRSEPCWSSGCFKTIVFQGHTSNFKVTRLQKIVDFDPDWALPDCNSSLNSPMVTKCCTKLEVA